MWKNIAKQLSLPESYISITLGFLVVIVAGLLAYNFFTQGKPAGESAQISQNETGNQTQEVAILPTSHTVSAGETLWSIAQRYYNSGYNWVTLVQENKLEKPDLLAVGQTLNIPKAETILPEAGKISAIAIEPKNYTVVTGDNLWNIAVQEYGDGFMWTKIAQANQLPNPNLILTGTVLKLPQS